MCPEYVVRSVYLPLVNQHHPKNLKMSILEQKHNDGINMIRYCLIHFIIFNKDVICMVYDLEENSDELNQKRQMQK